MPSRQRRQDSGTRSFDRPKVSQWAVKSTGCHALHDMLSKRGMSLPRRMSRSADPDGVSTGVGEPVVRAATSYSHRSWSRIFGGRFRVTSWIVVGGGFRGIVSAHLLKKAGHDVVLFERQTFLGSVHHSDEWNGFYLDKGCHLFGNDSDEATEIYLEMMRGEVEPVQVRYASVLRGIKSDGIAVPDLSVLERPVREKILYEVLEASVHSARETTTLLELLKSRYGPTAARYVGEAARKMYRIDADELDATALASAPFERIKIVEDDVAELLKASPALDERVAASSQNDPLKYQRSQVSRFPHRNFYPSKRGFRGFCDNARSHLKTLGVKLCLGESIESLTTNNRIELKSKTKTLEAERLLWTLDVGHLSSLLSGHNPLSELCPGVSMILYYFVLPRERVGPYSYVHDFTLEHLVYRVSCPGVYGNQTKADGSTYICCEVTTTTDSALWENPLTFTNTVWKEVCELGVVDADEPLDVHIVKTPVSYPARLKGYSRALAQVRDTIAAYDERLSITDAIPVLKKYIFQDVKRLSEKDWRH